MVRPESLHPDFFNTDTRAPRYHTPFIVPISGNRSRPLAELLYQSRRLEASDPRYHRFALPGLSETADDYRLQSDYSEAVQDIFVRYTKGALESKTGSKLLRFCSK